MNIKEYFLAGNKIIEDSMVSAFDFLNSNGQTVINAKFKFDWPERELYYTVADTKEKITYVLLKNNYKYNALYNSLITQIPLNLLREITRTKTGTDTVEQTGTQTNDVTFGKTITRTPSDYTITTTPSDTEQTVSGKDKTTVTVDEKPFDDAGTFSSVQKSVSENEPTDRTVTTEYTNNEVIKNVTDTDEEVEEGGTEGHTREDDLEAKTTYNTTEKETVKNTPEFIEMLEKYRELFSANLYDEIIKDIRDNIFVPVYESDYFTDL